MARKRPKKKQRSLKRPFIFFLLLLIPFAVFTFFKTSSTPYANRLSDLNIADYRKLEAKQIPLDIKKEMEKEEISAVFKLPILLYHYVEYVKDKNDTIRKSLNITPDIFSSQVETLLQESYTFITFSDLSDALDKKAVLPQKPIILTFDDGYQDFWQDVLPILKKYKVKATAYIVPSFIGRLNYMNEKELNDVAGSGLVEIGAHTMHHAYLKGQTFSLIKQEIDQSKIALEEKLHLPVTTFAYPYGAFDKQAITLVKKAGFKTAVTTVPGNKISEENRYFISRIRPGIKTGRELIDYLKGDIFKPY